MQDFIVNLQELLKNGQMVIVQVTKNPIGAKGARLTQEVSLAGRFVVMVPGQPQTYGISKRLPDEERRRLRKVLDAIRPDDAGLIVRTAAAGASAEELERVRIRASLTPTARHLIDFENRRKFGIGKFLDSTSLWAYGGPQAWYLRQCLPQFFRWSRGTHR